MNKIKLFIASALFCAMGYAGYITYERMTMSETEKFMLTNIEALTQEEQVHMGRLYYKGDNYYCCRLDTPDKPCNAEACPPGTIYGD